MSSPAIHRAQASIDRLVSRGRVPGIQYVVVGRDGVLLQHAAGTMDVATGAPVTKDTTFMASSVTKTLTAAAVLQLVDQGQLELGSALSAIVPEHPYGDDLQVKHLVNQTSGVPNPLPLKWLHRADEHDAFDEGRALDSALKRHARRAFAPGDRYSYSNLSYWLLGRVIETVSGVDYAGYLQQHLFEPLGISSAELGCVIPDPERHACGHVKRLSVLGLLMPWMMDRDVFRSSARGRRRFRPLYMNGPAYGGLIGTASALSKFLVDQLQPTSVLFGDDTKALFYSDQKDNQGRVVETTLGWHKGALGGTRYFGKPGGGPGYCSNLRLYPDLGIGSVWLANETAASEGPIHKLTDDVDRHVL